MIKYLRVSMPDKTKWDVMVATIADHRASYFAEKEVPNVDDDFEAFLSFEKIYDKEFHFTMENNDEIYDWSANNMNWEDVKEFASVHSGVLYGDEDKEEYQEGWVNGEKEIVNY